MPGARVARVLVREGELITLPGGMPSGKTRDALFRATAGLPFDVFRADARGLRAGQAVGLLEVGRLQLEILPKLQGSGGDEQDREFLMNLLAEAGLAPRLMAKAARISSSSSVFIEAVIEAFSRELLQRLVRGLPRRYAEKAEDLPVLRGRIDFTRMANRPPTAGYLLPVRYAPLHFDNPLSRVLRATVGALLPITATSSNRYRLRACDSLLMAAALVPLSKELLSRVEVTRYESEWRDALDVAQALVAGTGLNPASPGSTRLQGLLFSLNDLFESLLRRDLPRALLGTEMRLARSAKLLRLLFSSQSGKEVVSLKPDYLFLEAAGEAKVLVGDAKWKLLTNAGALGLASGDLYQLATYMTRHGLRAGVLFFPLQPWMREEGGKQWFRDFLLVGGGGKIRVAAVDVHALVARDPAERRSALDALKAVTLGSMSDSGQPVTGGSAVA